MSDISDMTDRQMTSHDSVDEVLEIIVTTLKQTILLTNILFHNIINCNKAMHTEPFIKNFKLIF